MSEVLAYDRGPITPVPALPEGDPGAGPIIDRPFLAVTQDGKGNVIYDGGFPKFYNIEIAKANGNVYPTVLPSTFAQLTPASKYLYNGLNFCANKRKVASGNRKILFVSNSAKGYSFVLTDSHYHNQGGDHADTGFRDTIEAICTAGNWTPTLYDLPVQSDKLDFSYEYLDQFAAVVFFSLYAAQSNSDRHVTENFAKNMAQYRAAGNGIAIITDHCGDNYTSLSDAVARGSVFALDATIVAKEYGCYFSGNVDRKPVLVSEIKRQIGAPGPPETHPLLAGLADTDYIYAGASESLVFPELYTTNIVDETQPYVVQMNTAGTYYVNVLVQSDAGDIEVKPMRFVIIDPSDIVLKDSLGGTISSTTSTYKRVFDYSLINTNDASALYRGEIRVNNNLHGYFKLSAGNIEYYPLAGPYSGINVADGDTVGFYIKQPFEYEIKTTVSLTPGVPVYRQSGSVSTFIKALRAMPDYTGKADKLIYNDAVRTGFNFYAGKAMVPYRSNPNYWNAMYAARLPFTTGSLNSCNLFVAPNPAFWAANKPTTIREGESAIIATTNEVYYYDADILDWKLHPLKANVLFGINRLVDSTVDSSIWKIGASTTVKQ